MVWVERTYCKEEHCNRVQKCAMILSNQKGKPDRVHIPAKTIGHVTDLFINPSSNNEEEKVCKSEMKTFGREH